MKQEESLFDLIGQATEMLLDRSRSEQDLIYYLCRMDTETRAAVVLAYDMLYPIKRSNDD